MWFPGYAPHQNIACYSGRPRKSCAVTSSSGELSLGPDRCGHMHQLVVHIDGIDALIIQAQEMSDGGTFRQQFLVAPHDVLEDLFTDAGRPIRCHPLVWAMGGGFCRLQTLHPHILFRNIVAGRQPRFGQEQSMVSVSYGHPS